MNRRLSDLINFSKELSILVVEDDLTVLSQLEKSLGTIFNKVITAENGQIALDKYFEYQKKHNKFVDIIFTDLHLPIMNGLEFCEKIKPYNEKQIIIATSAYADVHDLQRFINVGIFKFIPKPMDFTVMFNIITDGLEKLKEEKKRQELEYELTLVKNENIKLFEQSSLDKLTGLFNRRYIDDILEKFTNTNFTLVLTDIDNFKNVNDKYGHRTGDIVLERFAQILRTHTRSYDFLVRWGGEEFIIIFKDTNIETALFICNKLRNSIQQAHMPEDITLTSSFGVAVNSDNKHLNEILDEADKNLYNAKNQGRNRISYLNNIYEQ